MAFGDESEIPKTTSASGDATDGGAAPALSLEDRLASPQDRIAAVVADMIVLSPIATLVMAPFRKYAQESILQSNDDAWLLATVLAISASVLVVIAYQTYFLIKWRATPGKRLLGLTVESLWDEEGSAMRPQAAFIRSVAMCSEALLLGLPWIGVIGNERRRPFHDRLADTVVLSKKKTTVGVPNLSERALASGLFGAFIMSLVVIVFIMVGKLHLLSAKATAALTKGAQCEAIAKAEGEWIPAVGELKPSRMSLALALYESESIDEDCLKKEADAELWTGSDRDLSYLARGLSEKSDDDLSQSYLDKACDGTGETVACQALAFLNSDELPEDPVEAKAARVQRENDLLSLVGSFDSKTEAFLKILAIRELTQRRLEARALSLIDTFAPQKPLSFFLTAERAKALWALGQKPEARSTLKASIAGFDFDQRVSLTRWFCFAETSDAGCTTQARTSCDLLAASVVKDPVLLGDPEVTVSYLRGEACADRLSSKRLAQIKKDAPDSSTQAYLSALIELKKNEESGRLAIAALAEDEDDAGPFITESRLKLVELSQSEKDLAAVREAWLDDDPRAEGWLQLGRILMEKYNSYKSWDQTIEIGFKIGESEQLNANLVRPIVVAAYRSGQLNMAAGYLQTYFKAAPSLESPGVLETLRAPANVDGFDDVVKEIEADLNAPPVVSVRAPAQIQHAPAKLPIALPAKRHANARGTGAR